MKQNIKLTEIGQLKVKWKKCKLVIFKWNSKMKNKVQKGTNNDLKYWKQVPSEGLKDSIIERWLPENETELLVFVWLETFTPPDKKKKKNSRIKDDKFIEMTHSWSRR